MWVKRDPSEVEINSRKYLSPTQPLILFAIMFLGFMFSAKTGINKGAPPANPMTWDEFFSNGIMRSATISIVPAILAYIFQIVAKRQLYPEKPLVICDQCHKTKLFDKVPSCECGGNFVRIETMKWIEPKTSNKSLYSDARKPAARR